MPKTHLTTLPFSYLLSNLLLPCHVPTPAGTENLFTASTGVLRAQRSHCLRASFPAPSLDEQQFRYPSFNHGGKGFFHISLPGKGDLYSLKHFDLFSWSNGTVNEPFDWFCLWPATWFGCYELNLMRDSTGSWRNPALTKALLPSTVWGAE